MRAPSRNTVLSDRVLWYDGSSAYDPSIIHKVARLYDIKYVTGTNPQVAQYNNIVSTADELVVKTECGELNTDWNVPDDYKKLDIVQYVTDKHLMLTHGMTTTECSARDERLAYELYTFQKIGMFDVLRVVAYIVNSLLAHNIVWGVGRGSSVSSYVLYVIGLHDVDSFEYDLDFEDFVGETTPQNET